LIITVLVILMSVSVNSQVLLKKTVWNNENAFIGNEAAMDSISETYIKFKSQLSLNSQLRLEIKLKDAEIGKLNLQVDFLTKDNSNLSLQNNELQSQLDIKDKLHEADLMYWKDKSKGKLQTFLLGTAAGALIVT